MDRWCKCIRTCTYTNDPTPCAQLFSAQLRPSRSRPPPPPPQPPAASAASVMDQRVITKWYQPLRYSKKARPPKKAFVDIVCQDPARKRSKHSPTVHACSGRPRKRRPTKMEFDHELHLTSTLAWKAGQRRTVEK